MSAQVDVLAVMDRGNEARMALAVKQGVIGPQLVALEAEMREARAAVVELIEASGYIAFAMRDGAVFERDHAAQRLATALAACKATQP